MILKEVPEAEVTGAVGRGTSFEVTLNGTLIFSKLAKGMFPDFDKVNPCVLKFKEE